MNKLNYFLFLMLCFPFWEIEASITPSQDNYFLQGEEYFRKGQYDSALLCFNKSLRNDSTANKWRAQFEIASIHWKSGDYDVANSILDSLLALNNGKEGEARLLILKSKNHFSNGEPQEAVDLLIPLVAQIENPQDRADALNSLAKSKIWMGDVEGAKKDNQQADSLVHTVAAVSPILQGNISNVSGILHYFQGEYDLAIAAFIKALAFKKELLYEYHPDVVAFYGNIGVMYKNKAQYDKALEYYGYELEHFIHRLGESHPYVATAYQNIGSLLHAKGNHALALQAFKKSAEIRKTIMGADNPLTLDIFEWIGNVNALLGNFNEAESQFRAVLQGRLKKFGEHNHYTSLSYYNLGEILQYKNEYENSLIYFQKAIDIGEEIYDQANPDLATNYNGLGNSLLAMNKYVEAKTNYYKALEESVPDFEWEGSNSRPPSTPIYLRFVELFESLIGLAKVYSLDPMNGDLLLALDFAKAADAALTELKNGFTEDGDRITIAAHTKILADVAISIHHKLFNQTGDRSHQLEIFRWSELSKSSALLTSISEVRAKQISDIPDSLLILERGFRMVKDSLHNELLSLDHASQKDVLRKLKTAIFETSQEHLALIKHFETNFPKYAERKYGAIPATLAEVQTKLSQEVRQKNLLAYHYTSGGELLIQVVKADTSHLIVVANEQLVEQIDQLRNQLSQQQGTGLVHDSETIYQSIIKPVRQFLDPEADLLIISGGAMSYLPFELLMDSSGTYLFEDYNLSYEMSATIYAKRVQKTGKNNTKVLAFAPEFSGEGNQKTDFGLLTLRDSTLSPLLGAYKESNLVTELMGGVLKAGTEATESIFKQEAASYGILHLATHAKVNESNPEYSKLFLEESDQDDGYLHAFELRNLDLNAQLVTLSACNTGFGSIKKGEGVMSLSRAFAYAGVPATVVSLWPASDKSTPDLMKYFYQNLKDGQSKDVALNNARKKYLETATGKARHPFYWGGFVLIGDNSPIEQKNSNLVSLLAILFLMTMLPLILVIKKKYLTID